MIEKILLEYLDRKMSVPVFPEEPEDPPVSYVLIEKTGGGKENYIYSAMITIQSYAESLFLAAKLNEELKDTMDAAVELDEICSAELNSDYNYTDTSKKRYRYQAVYDVVHY